MTTRRVAIILIVLMLVVVGAALCSKQGGSGSDAAAPSATGDDAGPSRERVHSQTAEAEPVEESPAAGEGPPEDGWFRVTGTLTMIPPLKEDERVTFFLRPLDRHDLLIPVETTGGPIAVYVPEEGTYVVDDLERDDFNVIENGAWTPGGVVQIGRDQPLAIEVADDAEYACRLTLLDPDGKPVESAVVYEPPLRRYWSKVPLAVAPGWGMDLPRHEEADGGFYLRDGSETFYVRGGTSAWMRLDAPHPANRTVQLKPGGSLDVVLRGWADLLEPIVWLVDGTGSKAELPNVGADGVASWEGVPAGRHALEVRRWLLDDGENGRLYGQAVIDIEPGATSRVEIQTDPGGEARPVPMHIAIALADTTWMEERAQDVQVFGLDGLGRGIHLVVEDVEFSPAGTADVAMGSGPPGRYLVIIGYGRVEAVIEHGPARTRHRVDVGPSGSVEVHVVDEDSGEAVDDAGVGWLGSEHHRLADALFTWLNNRDRNKGPPPSRGIPQGGNRLDGRRADLPPGRHSLSVYSTTHVAPNDLEIEVESGKETRVVVRLPRRANLEIEVTLDGEHLTSSEGYVVITGPERRECFMWQSPITVGVAEGEWDIHVPRVIGYEHPDPTHVSLARGEHREITIDLKKLR